MRSIAVLVVAYNAESTLESVLRRIPLAVMDKIDRVVVLDDASQDDTAGVSEAFGRSTGMAKLVVLRNPVNLGYGGNQKRGYEYAMNQGHDAVVLLHGDGQYAPEVMQRLLDPLERGEADLVMGSRMIVRGAALRGHMPYYKFVGNKVLSALQNGMLGTKFSEFHSGYRAYSLRALERTRWDQLSNSWHFDTQIILEFLRTGQRIAEVPIPTYYGDEICHVNGIPYAWDCLRETALFALRTKRLARRSWHTSQGQRVSGAHRVS